jgi:cation diffusion facilitator family transporter
LRTSAWSMVGNFFLAIVKGTAGIFGHSYALVADALESVTDIFSSMLVYLGLRYAAKPPDENHPYGHGRVEPLVTFVVVGFLVATSTFIAMESIRHIRTPHTSPEPYTLIVLVAVIVFKESMFRWVRKKGDETHSTSLKADAWHHRSDALTSIAAFIGISIALLFKGRFAAADDWAALFAACFILYNSYRIFRPALSEVMDEQIYGDLVELIRKESNKVNGVLDTEKCHVRKAGMVYHVDLHAVVAGHISVSEGHEIAHQLKDHLLQTFPGIADVLVHIEPDALPVLSSVGRASQNDLGNQTD